MFSIWHALHCGALNFDMSAVLCVWPCSMLAYWQVYFGAQFVDVLHFGMLVFWYAGIGHVLLFDIFCTVAGLHFIMAFWHVGSVVCWHFGHDLLYGKLLHFGMCAF